MIVLVFGEPRQLRISADVGGLMYPIIIMSKVMVIMIVMLSVPNYIIDTLAGILICTQCSCARGASKDVIGSRAVHSGTTRQHC